MAIDSSDLPSRRNARDRDPILPGMTADLTPSRKVLVLVLQRYYAEDEAEEWLYPEEVADLSGLSNGSIYEGLPELADRGVLDRRPTLQGNGTLYRLRDRYRLL